MKGKRDRHGRRLGRRLAALGTAAGVIWLMAMTANAGAAAEVLRVLGESPEAVTGLLEAELGRLNVRTGLLAQMEGWQLAVLSQSPLLREGEAGVAAFLALEEGEQAEAAFLPAVEEKEDSAGEAVLPEQPEVVERTLTAGESERFVNAEDISVQNETGQTVDVAALLAQPVEITLGEGPQILIMHTHGSEAYTMEGEDVYTPSDDSRTTDENYNVVRIGEEMAHVFTELGLEVIHDKSLYDYPSYTGSYARSMAGVEEYLAKYPSIRLVLDIHRDALIGEDGTVYKAVTTVNEEQVAQVMMVVGTDDGGLEHPNWRENLALALKIQEKLVELEPTLARPVDLRSSRFNQHLTNGSLLVEVGTNGNTLQEAVRGARIFAQAAGEVFLSLREP